jgi:hypothetical protein
VTALTEEASKDGSTSERVRLLMDCRKVFATESALSTAVLIERLKADPEAPWCTYGANGLTANKMGALLREFDIRSANVRFLDGSQLKGYQKADFTDAWERYCPPEEPAAEQGSAGLWDGSSRPGDTSRPGLTSVGTVGTAGTVTLLSHFTGGAA